MAKTQQTASIYDWCNAKPRTLIASQRNQKQINQYLLVELEKKNKIIRDMRQDILTLKNNYQHTNQRNVDFIKAIRDELLEPRAVKELIATLDKLIGSAPHGIA
jgi:hypothetical protein